MILTTELKFYPYQSAILIIFIEVFTPKYLKKQAAAVLPQAVSKLIIINSRGFWSSEVKCYPYRQALQTACRMSCPSSDLWFADFRKDLYSLHPLCHQWSLCCGFSLTELNSSHPPRQLYITCLINVNTVSRIPSQPSNGV